MRNKLFQRLTSALCVLALLLGLAPTAFAADKPAQSDNRNKQNYTTYYASTVKSYLYANSSGGLTRVELAEGKIVVENYDSSFNMLSGQRLSMELPLWGGFFAGENANYIITGQTNEAQDDTREVVRVTKYDKNWNRVGHVSARAGDVSSKITTPFKAGSLRCAEYGGYLYIYTCAEGYADRNGRCHQSTRMFKLQESSMTFVDEGMLDTVSHSFNQYILIDQDRSIVTLDQGDANYRGAILMRYWTKAGPEPITWYDRGPLSIIHDDSFIQTFPGKSGENKTGAGLGGLAETSSGYVTAYAYDPNWGNSASRNIYLGYTSKSTMQSTTKKLTVQAGASTPVLAPTGLSGGYVLWNVIHEANVPTDTICYAPYSADGTVGTVQSVKGALSDCQPIYWNGKAVWYVTNYSAPVFYTLDSSGLKSYPANGGEASGTSNTPSTPANPTASPFSDIKATDWFYSDVMQLYNKSIVSGKSANRFDPMGTVTWGEALKLVMEACGYSAVSATGAEWAENYKNAAVVNGWVSSSISLTTAISTNEVAELICRVLNITPTGKASPYADAANAYGVELYYTSPQIFMGSPNPGGKPLFNGDKNLTRAQICAIIVRVMNLANS